MENNGNLKLYARIFQLQILLSNKQPLTQVASGINFYSSITNISGFVTRVISLENTENEFLVQVVLN